MRGNGRESALGAWGATDSRSGRRDSLHPPQEGVRGRAAREERRKRLAMDPERVRWSAGLVRNTRFTRAGEVLGASSAHVTTAPDGSAARCPRWMLGRPEHLADTPEATHEKRKAQPGRSVGQNVDRAAVGVLSELYREGGKKRFAAATSGGS
jgi:hypothetical protein